MPELAIVHRLSIPAPATHLVHVETRLTFEGTVPQSVTVRMPTWTPGSYLIREYSRHVEGFEAEAPAAATKIAKNAWTIRTTGSPNGMAGRGATLTFRYQVYAAELTVRTSHVDESQAFLVPASLFFFVDEHEQLGAAIELIANPEHRLATPLSVAPGESRTIIAPDFDTLVDSPIQLGTFRERSFDVLGKTHRYVITPPGAIQDADVERLTADTEAIVKAQATFFGGTLPYERYDFFLQLASRGRGGLEHKSSAALIAPASSFATREGYLDLLSLVAHELFHAWNVKRIRPAGLTPYRYTEENYTRLLWWFEGATSYYDWRTLVLARLCRPEEYLDHLAGEIAHVEQTPGRLVHSLEGASFDAWIKLYRPDENSANSSVNYYRKGEVVCAMLDIEIAARSSGRATLDSVLAHLWRAYGLADRPVAEDGMLAIFEEVAGVTLGDLFDAWIRSPGEVRVESSLARVGLTVERSTRADAPGASLGVRLRADGSKTVVLSTSRDGPAWRAGVDAGDEIVAIGGVRVESAQVDPVLRGRVEGQPVDVVLVRDGRLVTKTVTLDGPRRDRVRLVADAHASSAKRAAFASWLGQPHPASNTFTDAAR